MTPAPTEEVKQSNNVVRKLAERKKEAKLDPEFAEKILAFIVGEVIRHHRALAVG